jgi:DNA-binding NarL/FixJ family response regulator
MARIRVFVVDDHAVLRAGLRMLINAQKDMQVVGEAANAREAHTQIEQTAPDVVTLDLSMPGGSGLKLVEQIHAHCPKSRVLILTMHDDAAYCRAALAAGACGYVVKTAADTQLLTAIRAVAEGHLFVDPSTADASGVGPAVVEVPALRCGPALSTREQEVLVLLAQGLTNQAVADRLFLSVKTIETYRTRITEKLGLRTRADIFRYAVEVGLLGPDKVAWEAS